MKPIPSIVSSDEMVPPEHPEDGIVYVQHYGFSTTTEPMCLEITEKGTKLRHFEIRSTGCHTHLSSCIYELERLLPSEELDKRISQDLYHWLEKNRPLQGDEDAFHIRVGNEDLIFTPEGELKPGASVECPGRTGPRGEHWISIYDAGHFGGDDITIKVLALETSRIKLKLSGYFDGLPILFQGWFDLA